eukprot:scaffold8143_cov142-Skeletonema_marinoi.AAC.5
MAHLTLNGRNICSMKMTGGSPTVLLSLRIEPHMHEVGAPRKLLSYVGINTQKWVSDHFPISSKPTNHHTFGVGQFSEEGGGRLPPLQKEKDSAAHPQRRGPILDANFQEP